MNLNTNISDSLWNLLGILIRIYGYTPQRGWDTTSKSKPTLIGDASTYKYIYFLEIKFDGITNTLYSPSVIDLLKDDNFINALVLRMYENSNKEIRKVIFESVYPTCESEKSRELIKEYINDSGIGLRNLISLIIKLELKMENRGISFLEKLASRI